MSIDEHIIIDEYIKNLTDKWRKGEGDMNEKETEMFLNLLKTHPEIYEYMRIEGDKEIIWRMFNLDILNSNNIQVRNGTCISSYTDHKDFISTRPGPVQLIPINNIRLEDNNGPQEVASFEAIRAKILLAGDESNPTQIRIELSCEKDMFFSFTSDVDEEIFKTMQDNQKLCINFQEYAKVCLDQLKYEGSIDPSIFGSFNNTFTIKKDLRICIFLTYSFGNVLRLNPICNVYASEYSDLTASMKEMKKNYDLYVYICNMQNASNNTTLRLNWNVCFGPASRRRFYFGNR